MLRSSSEAWGGVVLMLWGSKVCLGSPYKLLLALSGSP